MLCDCSCRSIAIGIATLLDDPQKSSKRAEHARRIAAKFTMDRYLESLFAIYAEVLGRPTGAHGPRLCSKSCTHLKKRMNASEQIAQIYFNSTCKHIDSSIARCCTQKMT
jgi:hypothetical protein